MNTATAPARTPLLVIILLSYFMILLDNSIVFTGVPQIAGELGLGPVGISWVQNAYTLVFGGLLLLGSRAGDLLGQRRVFVAGLVVFSVASLLVGAAQSEAWIIAARALQGVGAAIVAPISLSLITAHFPVGPERTRAVAAYGTTAGLGASLGLLVGGALAQWVSWRAGYLINVPIGAVMIVAALRVIPGSMPRSGRFDLLGAVCSTLGMGGVILGIADAAESGWASWTCWVPAVTGAALLAVFVRHERRAEQPILPLRLFASAQRSGAAVARLLFAGTMIAFFLFTTQWFQGVYGFTPLQAGLGFLPMTVVQFGASFLVPRLVGRWGHARVLGVGVGLVFLGMVWMAFLTPGSPWLWGMAAPMAVIGLGQGLAFGPLTASGVAGAGPSDAGAASGLVNTSHQLGSTLGVALLTAVSAGAATLPQRITTAYTAGAGLLALAVLAVVVLVIPGEARARRRVTA